MVPPVSRGHQAVRALSLRVSVETQIGKLDFAEKSIMRRSCMTNRVPSWSWQAYSWLRPCPAVGIRFANQRNPLINSCSLEQRRPPSFAHLWPHRKLFCDEIAKSVAHMRSSRI